MMGKKMDAGDKKNTAGGSWSAGFATAKINLFSGPRKLMIFLETSEGFWL